MQKIPDCICCGSPGLTMLLNVEGKGWPHGEELHKQQHSYKTIIGCGACGCAQLEVYDHDCWDWADDWDLYWWYAFPPDAVEALKHLLQDCPSPFNPDCPCAIHQLIRHELSGIHTPQEVYAFPRGHAFAWLGFNHNPVDNTVSIRLDSSKPVIRVATQKNGAQPTIREQENSCDTAGNPVSPKEGISSQHEAEKTDDRFDHYEYYLIKGHIPVRFLVDKAGKLYHAEMPGADKKTWVADPTKLSMLGCRPEEFDAVEQDEFEQQVRDFTPRICTSNMKS